MNNKFLSICGLARRAGKIIIGTNMSVTAIRSSSKPSLVILSSDASENTVKKITDACNYHGISLITPSYTMADLGNAVGQSGGAACITVADDGFAKALTNLYHETLADSKGSQEVK